MINRFKKNFIKFCRLLLSQQFRRFIFFGIICNILGVLSIYIFTEYLKLHYIISLIIALIYVNFIGFCFNKFYTFNTSKKLFWQELWKYYNVMLSGFCINIFSMFVLVDIFKIWYITATLIVTVGLTFFNFFLHKFWSFNSLVRLKKGRRS
jgi:putative flippase GtrA